MPEDPKISQSFFFKIQAPSNQADSHTFHGARIFTQMNKITQVCRQMYHMWSIWDSIRLLHICVSECFCKNRVSEVNIPYIICIYIYICTGKFTYVIWLIHQSLLPQAQVPLSSVAPAHLRERRKKHQ